MLLLLLGVSLVAAQVSVRLVGATEVLARVQLMLRRTFYSTVARASLLT